MTMTNHRIGLVVPSSNVTVETEMPALLRHHPEATFTFHSSRMRMHSVSPEALRAMNAQRERCIDELADAGVDALLYACLVAVMAQGHGEHRRVEGAVIERLAESGRVPVVTSSAGALVTALQSLGVNRLALVTPYMRPLAAQVVEYLEAENFSVTDWSALEVEDNTAVGCIPGTSVMAAARALDVSDADALVISACVQMPSLDLIQLAEDEFGIPVLSAATAGAFTLLNALGLPTVVPNAGQLLSEHHHSALAD